VSDKTHIELALGWLNSGVITNESGEELFKLGAKHKHSIVKIVHADPTYTVEFKKEILEKTLGEDKSDMAENVRATCEALIPDAENKKKAWESFIDPNSTESVYKR
jgi:hypothetical protein